MVDAEAEAPDAEHGGQRPGGGARTGGDEGGERVRHREHGAADERQEAGQGLRRAGEGGTGQAEGEDPAERDQARLPGREAQLLLEVEGEQVEHGDVRQRGPGVGGQRPADRGGAQRAQVERWGAVAGDDPPFGTDELDAERYGGGQQHPDPVGPLQAERDEDGECGGGEQHGAGDVVVAPAGRGGGPVVREQEEAERQDQYADGHVEQEDGPPAGAQQVGGDDGAAEDLAERGTAGEGEHVPAQGAGPGRAGEPAVDADQHLGDHQGGGGPCRHRPAMRTAALVASPQTTEAKVKSVRPHR